MKIDKISYQKSFVIGPYLQHRIGLEIFLDEGEKPEEVLDHAKKVVDSWHKEQYPDELPQTLDTGFGQQPVRWESPLPTINREDQRLLDRIEDSDTLQSLFALVNAVTANPNIAIKDAWNKKHDKLMTTK